MLLRIVVLLPLVVGWIAALFALRGEIGSDRGEPVRVAMRTRGVLVSLPSVAPVRHDVGALGRHTHLSDEALVALVARGDESALGELYDRVGRVAYGIAYRVLRDDRLAEDAVQEGFLAAWRSAATFRADRAKASTWIVTLVHRRAVDIVRREHRRRAEPLETETRADPVDPAGSAEDTAWLGFERDRVQAALRALPDAQREAIELAYYGGYSQSELAERLGLPLGTIKSRMFAGLARLRELLDESESERSWTPRLTS
jgi:RNA polymerase sigma-70 factor (ECF subfamily)